MEEQIDYEERASLLKALSNPIRLQIVHGLLISGCHNVGVHQRPGTGAQRPGGL